VRKTFLILTLLVWASTLPAQKLTPLRNPAPDGANVEYLLTDGSVIVQGVSCTDWWKLTPDSSGSYVKGNWKQIASLPSEYSPYATSGAVLADGRFLLVGGEYTDCPAYNFTLTNQSAIYDPVKNTWKMVAPPQGWYDIGDSPSVVLPNGLFLLGRKTTKQAAVLDPASLKWTEVGTTGKSDFNAEEGWTLLPDGTVLTSDVKHNPNSEIYNPSAQTWTSAGSTIANLQGPPAEGCIKYGKNHTYCPPGEVGPAILRPDGTVFATGALHQGASTGHTAIYNPAKSGKDKWTAGPDFPNGDAAGDSFAALLTNGNALILGNSGTLYEFNGSTLTETARAYGSLIVLPTGQVLVGGDEVYTSTGTYKSSWAPRITSYPESVSRGSTYKISGQQFNGLSQAAAFGDEFGTATNYPLVRITNNATRHVFYAKTHDHSTMGVATGKATVFTHFDIPEDAETGESSLVVVANGIPSKPVSITIN
jgi:hypothetical protein